MTNSNQPPTVLNQDGVFYNVKYRDLSFLALRQQWERNGVFYNPPRPAGTPPVAGNKNKWSKTMSRIIISADYFGKAVLAVRRKDNIPMTRLTHLFGCDTKQMHNYIHGYTLMPQDALQRIIRYAIMVDKMQDSE